MSQHIVDEQNILRTISLIRTSFQGATEVYSMGGCVKLAMILKSIYHNGEIWHSIDHTVFKLHENYYDIHGLFAITKAFSPMSELGILKIYQITGITPIVTYGGETLQERLY